MFIIKSPTGATFGSFRDQESADTYASALRESRGVICDVQEEKKEEPPSKSN